MNTLTRSELSDILVCIETDMSRIRKISDESASAKIKKVLLDRRSALAQKVWSIYLEPSDELV